MKRGKGLQEIFTSARMMLKSMDTLEGVVDVRVGLGDWQGSLARQNAGKDSGRRWQKMPNEKVPKKEREDSRTGKLRRKERKRKRKRGRKERDKKLRRIVRLRWKEDYIEMKNLR